MPEWLYALLESGGGTPSGVTQHPDAIAVLVTVAHTQGSVPRLPGARMVFTATGQNDTIGGGHLEWKAGKIARRMLTEGTPTGTAHLERLPLGPSLGQCCGGVVWLVFERIDATARQPFHDVAAAWSQGLASQRRVRIEAASDADAMRKLWRNPPASSGRTAPAVPDTRIEAAEGALWLLDTITPFPNRLVLFGAGHVGAALVHVLQGVPCHISWIDARETLFPAALPANVCVEATDTPEAVIDAAADDSCFLVMTHSHALDLRLTEAILRKGMFRWFGLIGSQTKRASFEQKLRARGVDDASLRRLCCPIGLPGIEGKEPAVIALAVAAQLLQIWQSADGAVTATNTASFTATAANTPNMSCGAAQ